MNQNSSGNQTLQAIGGGTLALSVLGTIYIFWSITQGVSVDYLRPYFVASIFALIIGSFLYLGFRPKRSS